jgi:carbonic anhydrase
MRILGHLFDNNKAWAERIRQQDPEFFLKLSRQQVPSYLWIGCSDSRVPANEIVGLLPGELFVHRNIANLVVHTDLNCLSVLQFAVDILKVSHIIVCGHYGCSGVGAVFRSERLGLSDNWLRHVQDVRQKHEAHLEGVAGGTASGRLSGLSGAGGRITGKPLKRLRAAHSAPNTPLKQGVSETWVKEQQSWDAPAAAADRLCELNVIEQAVNVCQTTIARDAWERGQELAVHGWIYGLKDGLLRDLNMTVCAFQETLPVYQAALAALD